MLSLGELREQEPHRSCPPALPCFVCCVAHKVCRWHRLEGSWKAALFTPATWLLPAWAEGRGKEKAKFCYSASGDATWDTEHGKVLGHCLLGFLTSLPLWHRHVIVMDCCCCTASVAARKYIMRKDGSIIFVLLRQSLNLGLKPLYIFALRIEKQYTDIYYYIYIYI